MKRLFYIAFGVFQFTLGLNIYFAMWYLGTATEAVSWSFDRLTFVNHVILANGCSILISAFMSWLSRTSLLAFGIYYKRNTSYRFLAVWAGSMLLFTLLYGFALTVYFHLHYALIEAVKLSMAYISSYNFLSLLIYYFTLGLVVLAFLNLWRRIGSFSKLFHHLLDAYVGPIQEKRGFMFIDLNHSTAIAESLGHERYSQLIRECFKLLDQLLKKAPDLEVYQYVGDEAVLSWDFNKLPTADQAVDLFIHFKKRIAGNTFYFQKEYGCVPQFKCGMHGGMVIKTQIGRSSMHMAYHGDVVNATSRILSLCHSYKTDLLVSEKIFQTLGPTPAGYHCIPVKAVPLNGRQHKINLYSIQKPPVSSKMEQSNRHIHNSLFITKNDYQSNFN